MAREMVRLLLSLTLTHTRTHTDTTLTLRFHSLLHCPLFMCLGGFIAQREAVSTSHCSQSNTIEYEMAMEWCLLQERSELSWKKLYKVSTDLIILQF
jgi:hypothetical protein